MTRAETLAAAGRLDRPATAYIVRFPSADGFVDVELGWADLARDTEWAAQRLRGLGVETGWRALVTASGFEGPWSRPVIDALRSMRVTYAIAEAMGWDHGRTAVFHRELAPQAVIGLSAETVEGLSGRAELREMFRDTALVLARPDAVRVLRAAGVSAGVIAFLGPALALECAERAGAHVNAAEWRVRERDGELSVAAGEGRAGRLAETPLGVGGRVVTGRCPCGSEDPRVLFG